MDLNRWTAKAKDMLQRRGGTDSLKEDAAELRDIAGRKGSTGDKAKAAFEAIKEPGAPKDGAPERAAPPPPPPAAS
ncbi:MAG TPA: hypothetical protein VGM33_20095 [Baekduia sp.]|jgi:hypothetical protein